LQVRFGLPESRCCRIAEPETTVAEFKRPLKGVTSLLPALFESADDFIAIYDMQFRFTAFNTAFQREFEHVFGRRVEIGMSLRDALGRAPDGRATIFQLDRAYRGEEFMVTAEFGGERRSRNSYEKRLKPVHDSRGRQIGVLEVARKLTARPSEQALGADAERARLEAVINCMTEGVIIAEPSGNIISANPAALSLHEFSSQDEAKRQQPIWPEIFETRYPDGRRMDAAEWPLQRAAAGETVTNIEILVRNRRTGKAWVGSYSASLCRAESGEIMCIVVEIRDITDRTRAEQTLRESEERFRNMADTAPVMICVSGPDKRATFFNRAWLAFTGRTMEQELGDGWTVGVHPDDIDRCLASFSSSFDGRRNCEMEYRLRRSDGEYRLMSCSGVPRFEPGGVFAGYIGSCVDITDLKRAQEENLARQKLESVGVMAGGIAHDFNNLLGSIVADAELALTDLAPGIPAIDEIQRIRAVALRASEIVRELMIYTGQETAEIEPVDVSLLVSEMLELLKVSISKHATLKTDLAKGLAAIRANAPQIRQVVMNLVINASEAIGDMDGVIHVSAAQVTLAEAESLRLEVSDTGCGMTAETRERIFDPFFTTKFAGRGLGLAVVQGIVRSHGGFIHIVSAPGQGTRFQIFFPCAAERAPENQNDLVAPPPVERIPGGAATILMVEDEEAIRLTVSKMLRKKGFSVMEAPNGAAAIELLRAHENEVGVILLDMTIPGASSREVYEEALRLRRGIKVVLTTAYSREIATASLNWPQVEGFIRKPYQIHDLVRLLQDVLER
jgi:two-component system, cell cycle sensor histidine kinase and response regulator CckA